MYCRKCGTELREDDKFCYHCGERTGLVQRMLSSKAFIGSVIALLVVAAAAVLTYFIWTGKLKLPAFERGRVVDEGRRESDRGTTASPEKADPTRTPEPTATPYVFQPADVTKEMKKEIKPLTNRLMPFLAYSASFYADGSHKFRWNDGSATVMALYNLEHYDKSVRYGNLMKDIEKKAKQEMKKLFGKHYKYKFKYEGTYPGYVYRPTGNTMVFNASRVPGKKHNLKVSKITEYEEGKYRITVEAYMSQISNGTKGDAQKYTVLAEKDEKSAYGYVVQEIKLKKAS